jgi:mitochondrial fission protein ELM1
MTYTCWGITDGSAGMAAQVKALAASVGVDVEMKVVRIKKPWVKLPNIFYSTPLRHLVLPLFIERGCDTLEGPWPDMIISCGRRAAIVTSALKSKIAAQQKEKVPYFIHIQDPQMHPRHFDMVVAMAHDKVQADNVIKTQFALHQLTPVALAEARQHWEQQFAHYRKPLVAVLLGGSTNKYTLTTEAIDRVVVLLERLLKNMDGSLLITPSRRTGEENIARLRAAFEGNDRVYLYDFESENPYMGMVALADAFIVTNDSVNMMSEAAATGKPVHIIAFAGHSGTKPSRFAGRMIRSGVARPLGARLETWEYKLDNEMLTIAETIRQNFLAREQGDSS